jgi:hypothetical protein
MGRFFQCQSKYSRRHEEGHLEACLLIVWPILFAEGCSVRFLLYVFLGVIGYLKEALSNRQSECSGRHHEGRLEACLVIVCATGICLWETHRRRVNLSQGHCPRTVHYEVEVS